MTTTDTITLEEIRDQVVRDISNTITLNDSAGVSARLTAKKIIDIVERSGWQLTPHGKNIAYQDIQDGDLIRVADTDMTLLIRAARTPSGVFGGLLSMVPRNALFYLVERRPPLVLPTEAGSLIRVEYRDTGTTTIALGKDNGWYGISHAVTDEQLRQDLDAGTAKLLEVLA